MKLNLKITVTREEINAWYKLYQFQNEEEVLEDIHDWIINDIQVFIQDTDIEMIVED